MKKTFIGMMLMSCLAVPAMSASGPYGLPDDIQEGNILHCFNWKISDVRAELKAIAEAGFGAVQLSPMQRDASVGAVWNDVYRPYDFRFIASGMGTADELRSLCDEAGEYGIKVIVDVVANHVDGHGAGNHTLYHDPWWNENNRLRWNGSVNYGDRYSITHNQMGGGDGYPDVDSENPEVAARAKAYVEELKSYGVKGIRWDAAKHIALPSEGCGFWSTVTSVPDMYHYGEVLDNPGGSNGTALMKEYTQYMSVTDNGYSDAARNADGTPDGYAGWAAGTLADDKVVYWGESHDTYSNDGGQSKYVSQATIDRAYAIVACRRDAVALYLSRPAATANNDIKIGVKGSTQFKSAPVAEVNKFRNAMTGRPDYYSKGSGVSSVTRKDGGAVIVRNGGGGYVSVANGGGYCPAGTYTDRVSGGQFTVTATTISGNVGASGIAVIYDGSEPVDPIDPIDPVDPTDDVTIYYDNSVTRWPNVSIHYWSTPSTDWPGVAMTHVKDDLWKYTFPSSVASLAGFLFCDGTTAGGDRQTADYVAGVKNGYIYKGAGGYKGGVSQEGEYIDTTTGIDGVAAADSYSVMAVTDGIAVSGAEGRRVIVAGVDGRVYYSGIASASDITVPLSSGLYIVSVDGRCIKIRV